MHAQRGQIGNWDDLRFFLAVARHGRLSAAAHELGVNHSTVFRRIASLEERLGTRLFDRHSSGHALTAAGEEMLGVAQKIEDEVIGLDRQVLGRDRALTGLIRVTTAGFDLGMAQHFASFLAEHPGVDLEVLIDTRFLSLHRREADVAVRAGPKPTEPDLVVRKVADIRFGVYASQSYIDRRGRPASAADLAEHDIVGAEETLAHMPTARWLEQHMGGARVRFRASTVLGQVSAIAAGIGVGAVPCSAADGEPELVRLFMPDDIEAHGLWLVYHGDLRQTARVRAFISHLADALAADQNA